MPDTRPDVMVRPTARRALRDVALVIGLSVAAILAVVAVGATDGRLTWPVVALVLLLAGAGGGAVLLAVRRWGRVQPAELLLGYTTTTFALGRFWFGAAPDAPWTLGWIKWDWRGTWVVRPDGSAVSAPTGDADPPGLYPSPNREGAFELWTGCQWSGYFPDISWTECQRPREPADV